MGSTQWGGCACGAIRYRYSGDVMFALNCHCRDCQRESGSGFVPVLGVRAGGFEVTQGSPRLYAVRADSGNMTQRAFCCECGSPLYGVPDGHPDLITIRAGSLDDASVFRPQRDIFTSSAQPWDYMNPALPKVSKIG